MSLIIKIILEQEYIKKIKNWVEIVSIENLMGKKEQFDEKAFTEFKQKIDLIHSKYLLCK